MTESRILEWLLTYLVDRGLSLRQLRVLLAVMWCSEATAVMAADRSGVEFEKVYRYLGELVDRGLLVRREPVWPESAARWRLSDDQLVLSGLKAASAAKGGGS
jgi:hypothetical protein